MSTNILSQEIPILTQSIEKMTQKCMCVYHILNITELSNRRRRLIATLAKCNLHK